MTCIHPPASKERCLRRPVYHRWSQSQRCNHCFHGIDHNSTLSMREIFAWFTFPAKPVEIQTIPRETISKTSTNWMMTRMTTTPFRPTQEENDKEAEEDDGKNAERVVSRNTKRNGRRSPYNSPLPKSQLVYASAGLPSMEPITTLQPLFPRILH